MPLRWWRKSHRPSLLQHQTTKMSFTYTYYWAGFYCPVFITNSLKSSTYRSAITRASSNPKATP
jgi:hypothetical protein